MDTYPPFKVSGAEQNDNHFMKCYLGCGTPLEEGRPRNDSQYECWSDCRQSKANRMLDEQAARLAAEGVDDVPHGGHKRKKRTRRRRKNRRKKRKTHRKKRKTRRRRRRTK